MKIFLINLLVLFVFVSVPVSLLAQEEGEKEEKEGKNEIAVFLGATTNEDATAFTYGLDYQYRISKLIGVGALVDHAAGDMKSTLVAPAFILHVRKFSFKIAPGLEFSDETTAVLRVGAEYEIKISKIAISPAIFFDTERSEKPSLVYGLSFGFEF